MVDRLLVSIQPSRFLSTASHRKRWITIGTGCWKADTPSQCGWLTDKFGVSWQIVPTRLGELLNDPDPVKAKRAMDAMLKMVKLDVGELERAYTG